MDSSCLVLLPPLVVIIIASLTRKVVTSLFLGIMTALFILRGFSLITVGKELVTRIWHTTELSHITSWENFCNSWYLFICLFLLVLGIIISLIKVSGGAFAYGNFIFDKIKNKRTAQFSSLLLSLLFFVDDYFSSLTVGSVMHTITDRFRIPRVKTALLVNVMAAPLVVMLPVSSWVAEIIMQLKQSGVSAVPGEGTLICGDPLFIYVKTIPFIFYALIAIVSLVLLIMRGLSFGILYRHEMIAHKTGNLFAGKTPVVRSFYTPARDKAEHASIWDFLFPLTVLFSSVILAILYRGHYHLLGGNNSLLIALQNSHVASALFMGSLITLLATILFLLMRKKIKVNQLVFVIEEGIKLMAPSIIILILIWTLSALLKGDLGTGKYLAHLITGHVSLSYLPFIFFVVSLLTSTMMGSAWGTLGIYIPIAIPMLTALLQASLPINIQNVDMIFPLLGAIISGAVVGNHLSPISDTMLMSSASVGAYHIDLVRAQIEFALPTVAASAVAFLTAGLMIQAQYTLGMVALGSLFIGIILNIVFLSVLSLLRSEHIFD